MRIEKARRECANNVTADFKCLMDRRRLMHRAGDRLEILRVKCERIQITVPAHRIERMMRQRHAGEARAVFDQNIDIFFFVDGDDLGRRVEIALGIGRAHFDLALVIEVTLWNSEPVQPIRE